MPVLDELEPSALWRFFGDLTQIPRPSFHEQRVIQFIKDFAGKRSLAWEEDAVGNLVVRRPGSGGGEEAPTVAVQAHVDMVCEKNADVEHDFLTDPIKLKRVGDWIAAEGTTLGADNGIGAASALALLDMPSTVKLPPLECLFTVSEEVGLIGAAKISPDLVKAKTMLNLDTEDFGEIFIGCAGGGDTTYNLAVSLEPATADAAYFNVSVSGLLGGHSGINIAEGRGNAVQLLAGLLQRILKAVPSARLAWIKGGDKRNAIPREAFALLSVIAGDVDALQSVVSGVTADYSAEYGLLETGLLLVAQPASTEGGAPPTVVRGDADRLLGLLLGLQHGPYKFSRAAPGVVETSNNLASVHPEPTDGVDATSVKYVVTTSTRSLVTSALEYHRDRLEAVARLSGADVNRVPSYPGWAPNPESAILKVTQRVFEEVNGHAAEVKVIHAGLECGILGEKFPGIDIVSYGPTIKGAHSPDEKVLVPTVKPFWDITLRILQQLADVRA